MNLAKRILTMQKTQIVGSSGRYFYILGLVSLVIVGALAVAATKTTDGYVLLYHTIHSFTAERPVVPPPRTERPIKPKSRSLIAPASSGVFFCPDRFAPTGRKTFGGLSAADAVDRHEAISGMKRPARKATVEAIKAETDICNVTFFDCVDNATGALGFDGLPDFGPESEPPPE